MSFLSVTEELLVPVGHVSNEPLYEGDDAWDCDEDQLVSFKQKFLGEGNKIAVDFLFWIAYCACGK